MAAALGGVVVGVLGVHLSRLLFPSRRGRCSLCCAGGPIRHSYFELIGSTPMLLLESLSRETGCTILAKCEFMNPGGSGKDRVARAIVSRAVEKGANTVFEGTSGSTGISISLAAHGRGVRAHICMPNDQAAEKAAILRALGATVDQVPPVSIIDSNHYVNRAKRLAREAGEGGYYGDQFENECNRAAHRGTTGPEIWAQCSGRVDAFVMGAGTGGTIAGVGDYLRSMNPRVKVILADVQGSSLYNRVVNGVMFAPEEKEGTKRRHQVDSIVEGIGLNRMTANFEAAVVDTAFRCTDQEVVDMSRRLLREEGVWVGSSSATNCAAARKAALEMGPGHTIVTVLCDSGQRHTSRFWNKEFLERQGLRA